MVKFLSTLFIILLFFEFAHSQQATLYFSPETTTTSPIDTFTVEINIENVVDLHGYSVFVSFPQSFIECLSTEPGFFLGSNTFYYPNINNSSGMVQVDQVILGSGAVSGSGNLFKLIFRSFANGYGSLLFSQYDLRDSQNNSIPASIEDGFIQAGLVGLNIEPSVENKKNEISISIFPNPFNSSSNIVYWVPARQLLTITVFDIQSKEIKKLFNGIQQAGEHWINWNGENSNGISVASGLYLLNIRSLNQNITHKLMLVK